MRPAELDLQYGVHSLMFYVVSYNQEETIRIASPLLHRLSNPTRDRSCSSSSLVSSPLAPFLFPISSCWCPTSSLFTSLCLPPNPLSIPWFPPVPRYQQWPTTTTTISPPPRPRASRSVRRRLSRSTRSLVSSTLSSTVHANRAIDPPPSL